MSDTSPTSDEMKLPTKSNTAEGDSLKGNALEGNDEFEQAVARCIHRLENGRAVDPGWLKQTFPRWHRELGLFIADWGAVEGFSSEIRNAGNLPLSPGRIPETIGEYKIIDVIGSGGMGVIYKAQQQNPTRVVAIKMLQNVRHDRKRFQMEVASAAQLDHPNIVSIYEVGEHEGQPFFTMPFVDGCDLGIKISTGKLSPIPAATIAERIAEAVHFAHQRGILHRDLKPGNILLDSEDQPHVTDLGLAKQIECDDQLTRSNAIIGTPGYMAPEQAQGKNADVSVATDVYGIGAVLYAMLTGQAPFGGKSFNGCASPGN